MVATGGFTAPRQSSSLEKNRRTGVANEDGGSWAPGVGGSGTYGRCADGGLAVKRGPDLGFEVEAWSRFRSGGHRYHSATTSTRPGGHQKLRPKAKVTQCQTTSAQLLQIQERWKTMAS